MKIEITLIDKILIGLSIVLYLLGYFFGGWNIFFNLICLFFILTLLKKSYNKKKLSTLYLIFFIFFIIFNILIKIGFIFNLLQNYSLKLTNTKIKVSPTKTVRYLKPPKTKEEIIWKKYNFVDNVDNKVSFSFKFPDVGDYCNGCFDSAGVAENAHGQWITGSYYKDDYEKKWSLKISIFYPYLKYKDGMLFDDSIGIFLDKLRSLEIGEKLENKGEYQSSTITRIKDIIVMGKISKQYTINSTSHYVGNNEITKKVIVDFSNFSIIIDYSYISPIYDVFEEILSSFSTKLYVQPDYGEPLEKIITPSPSPGWKRYIDNNGNYYLDFPNYFVWNKQGENDIIFEKNLSNKLEQTNSFIRIKKGESDQITKDDLIKLKKTIVGEKIILSNKESVMDQFKTYERLPDALIDNKKFIIFLNKKPFEFPNGTYDYVYIYSKEGIDYVIFGLINESHESLNNISFEEFKEIISTLKFID